MPVNTASLKTFAPTMRRQLLEAVGRKLDLLLNSQTPDTLSTYARQIAELREQEAKNREQLLEQVAYTWFNRLCALRYLDARGWHPFGCKVLMPASEGETQPELLKLMRAGSLPAELKSHTNEARLHGLLDSQIPPAIAGADPQGEVYRELVLASCRSYHQLLPELFEGLDDASELLLPDDLLSEGSIAGGFRSAISDEDCEDVEIIGWLYQFYISEKKDQVIGKVVKSEDIPAATQLFTPNWIVKYMVQNSLGATWLATYPDSPLKGQMEFYIEPAEQTPEVQAQQADITPESLDPEELTLVDPACGSGHILVEAYDLLKAIYLERGYRQRDIPELILTKNLYGLDICPRAAQLAAFSLLMKGREDDRRLLERGIQLNVMAFQDSKGLNVETLADDLNLTATGLSHTDLRIIAEQFTHATTFGSLIQVPTLLAERLLERSSKIEKTSSNLFAHGDVARLEYLLRQATILSRRYDAVVANPPYMGRRRATDLIRSFLESQYSPYKSDLFSAFIGRSFAMAKKAGRVGMMTPTSWMYLSSFSDTRESIFKNSNIHALTELDKQGFRGAAVHICTFVLYNSPLNGSSKFISLEGCSIEEQSQVLSTIEEESNAERCHTRPQLIFEAIPGKPIAYWLSDNALDSFRRSGAELKTVLNPRQGMATGDNEYFLRLWHEIDFGQLILGSSDQEHVWEASIGKRPFVPYNKGGSFRKWFGNRTHVIAFSQSDYWRLKQQGNHCPSEEYYFKECITWSDIVGDNFAARYCPQGSVFDVKGSSAFPRPSANSHLLLGLLNSKVTSFFKRVLNPGTTFQVGDISRIPFYSPSDGTVLSSVQDKLLALAKEDWDAYERSWDFDKPGLLRSSIQSEGLSIEANYLAYAAQCRRIISEMKELEEQNNKIFIEAYRLRDDLDPDVPLNQVTINSNPAYRYGGGVSEEEQWEQFRRDTVAELNSYIVGCIMGRYSLDSAGLVIAESKNSQDDHMAAYREKVSIAMNDLKFKPDPDSIIPFLDSEWFEDDIVSRTREFIEVAFPNSTATENLRFIESSLGKEIRKYFCSEFYKDHLQAYKKRPIYWMVQSPKKGFSCLIYIHRYTKDTLNQVLNNYLRPYLQKLEARLGQLTLSQINDDLSPRERTTARKEAERITKVIKECRDWEQANLLPLAQQRIELNLDAGVKANYLRLQEVLAPIPGL